MKKVNIATVTLCAMILVANPTNDINTVSAQEASTSSVTLPAPIDQIFSDDGLADAVADNSEKSVTDTTTTHDLANVEKSDASYREIISLEGIELLPNLVEFSLYKSEISDICPLESLTNLEWLQLAANNIEDSSSLESLSSQTYLCWNYCNNKEIENNRIII